MPDTILPPTKFEINKTGPNGGATALLPTLGTRASGPLDVMFQASNVEDYLYALHASLGDIRSAADGITEAAKALNIAPPQAMTYARMSFMPDPANYGLMSWPGIQPDSLRKITRENLIPQIVIRSRVTDLRRYSPLSSHPWSPGWKIALCDAARTPSKQDLEDIKEAERFICNCSRDVFDNDPRVRDAHQVTSFETFLAGAADDTLTFDGWAIWTERDRIGRVRAFANLPAGLIRLSQPGKGFRGHKDIFAAMVDETGTPAAAFTRDDLTWAVRNVRNDPSIMGYGWAESEMAIRVVQGYQSAVELNVSTFDRSAIPNGMLLLKGDFWQQDQIDALTREWTNMKRGVSKLWGMPVMAIPEDGEVELLQFMDMKGEDVRYKDHMNMMMGIYCIISQFPIRRLGLYASGNHRDNQPVPDGSVETQGVDDPGLPALLTFIENQINPYLLQPNWPNLKFEFQAKNPKEDARAYVERTKARTWKESRAEADLPALTTLAPSGMEYAKEFLQILELCPEDPAKIGVYQTLALAMFEQELGINDVAMAQAEGAGGASGKEGGPLRDARGRMMGSTPDNKPGSPFASPKDPAASQEHGHRAGVRRSAANARPTT